MPLLLVFCFVVLVPVVLSASAAAAGVGTETEAEAGGQDGTGDVDSELLTDGPFAVHGASTVHVENGSLQVLGAQAARTTSLQAGTLRIETAWEEGVVVNGDGALARRVTDAGQRTVTVDEATATFSTFQGTPQFVQLPADVGAVDARLETDERMDVELVEGRTVARVGPSSGPSSQDVGESPQAAFSHTVDDPVAWASVRGPTVTVRGDFSLFVHNVTYHVNADTDGDGQAEESRSNWTGYREDDPGQPTTRYERRVTVLHVRDGRLVLDGVPELDLWGGRLASQTQGVVSAESVSGRLAREEATYVYDRSPFLAKGAIGLSLGVATPDDESDAIGTEGPRLSLAPSGEFQLHISSEVDVLSPTGAGGDEDEGWLGSPLWISLGVGGLLLAGVVASRGPGPRELLARWRTRRYETWMERGWAAFVHHEFEAAAKAYGKAARIRPNKSAAWFQCAISWLEAGDFDECRRIAAKAEELEGSDLEDLVELQASAAYEAGDEEEVREQIRRLIEISPGEARSFVRDLEMEDALDPDLEKRLNKSTLEGPLDGYV